MIRGKGTQAATGVLVLLFAAGSASAVPTFPVCLRGPDTLRWMTESPIFDAVLIATQGRDTRSPTPEALPVSVPRDPTDMIAISTISSSAAPLMTAGQISVGDNPDKWRPEFRGTTCEIPSPGTLLLGAMGAFLVGALRMRRML